MDMDWWCKMAKLSLWLPPFSPDYSGASAVLFDLKTVTAMHDASGCTGNFTGYDEPRWYGSASGIFCSGLRQIDAVLGDDEKLIRKMIRAAEDIKPDLMALVGSPVPMVIGADLEGIAAELEARTQIPCFGFDTTGTAYYDKGAFKAAKALLDRFAENEETIPGRINILGALPMDFGNGEDIGFLEEFLSGAGYEMGLCLPWKYGLQDLKHAASAQVNLAISRFGYLTAVYMEKKFQIPYLCGFPAGKKGAERWLSALERVIRTEKSEILRDGLDGTEPCGDPFIKSGNQQEISEKEQLEILIVGEQVMANSIRAALFLDFGIRNVTVGCIYGREPALSAPQDLDLKDEKEIRDALNQEKYTMIIADPFLKAVFQKEENRQFLPFAQYAVSSKLGEAASVCVTQGRFNQWFEKRRMK